MLSERSILLIVLGCIVLIFLYICMSKTRENYGGKVKKIRKIPFNDCVRIINTYLVRCLEDNKYGDPGFCYERFGPRGTAIQECYYSNYHRV